MLDQEYAAVSGGEDRKAERNSGLDSFYSVDGKYEKRKSKRRKIAQIHTELLSVDNTSSGEGEFAVSGICCCLRRGG